MILGSWNVRTLLDLKDTERPERRTALVARELARFSVDIAALSETRISDEGQLEEIGAGYTFFWKGRGPEERRDHGVGFAIKSHLVKTHNLAPKAIYEQLMTIRIPLQKNCYATVVSAYAPTLDTAEEIKKEFYQQLETAIIHG